MMHIKTEEPKSLAKGWGGGFFFCELWADIVHRF